MKAISHPNAKYIETLVSPWSGPGVMAIVEKSLTALHILKSIGLKNAKIYRRRTRKVGNDGRAAATAAVIDAKMTRRSVPESTTTKGRQKRG